MKAGFLAALGWACLVGSANATFAQVSLPNPPSSLPNPPASLTVPNPLAGLQPGPVDLYKVDRSPAPDQPSPGTDRFQKLIHPNPLFVPDAGFVYVGPWPYVAPEHAHAPRPAYRRLPEQGALRFDTVPAAAQVFVDGSYVGIVDDFRGAKSLALPAGLHRISLRAADYEPLDFDVLIAPSQVLRYRGDMRLIADSPLAPPRLASPARPKTFYVIRNCYAGDRPPPRRLPAGCKASDVRVVANH